MNIHRAVLWRALLLLRPAWGRLAISALAAAAASGCGVALMATAAWLIVRAAQHPPVLTLMVAVVAVRAFGIGRGLLRYAERLVSHDAAFAALGEVRVRVYQKLERLAPIGLPVWRRGDLLTRLVTDVDEMQDLALRGLLPIASAALVFTATLGLAFVLLPSAALILAVALSVAGLFTPWLWVRACHVVEDGLAGERAHRAATIVELLDASTDLMACGAADQWLAKIDDGETRVLRGLSRSARLAGVGIGVGILAVAGAVWETLIVAVPAVEQGSLAGPALAVLVLTPLALSELVQALPAAAQHLQRVRPSATRVLEILDTPDPVKTANASPALPTGALIAPHLRLSGLDVTWPGRELPALHALDLDLPAGRRVAIVGPSGAGKSTLLAALLCFVEPSAGAITLDGIDVRTLDDDDVRSLSALCDHDAYLFDSSIAENVRLARPGATDADLLAVLRQARLTEWIEDLPSGIHTRVGEHGALVSGGQRQRIALARALLAGRPLLLLDEPTAGLDEPTAAALLTDLLGVATGRTTVLVTHRLAGLELVDEILVLDHGRVLERGTQQELMRRTTDGRYPANWDIQAQPAL